MHRTNDFPALNSLSPMMLVDEKAARDHREENHDPKSDAEDRCVVDDVVAAVGRLLGRDDQEEDEREEGERRRDHDSRGVAGLRADQTNQGANQRGQANEEQTNTDAKHQHRGLFDCLVN